MTRALAIAVLLAAASAGAQPDPEGGVVVLGWSKKGTHVALRAFSQRFAIENSCAFSAQIVDVVSDKVVWSGGDMWVQGNMGGPEDTSPPCPGAQGAWRMFRSKIEAAMSRFGIALDESRSVKPFPRVTDGDTIDVVVKLAGEKGYEVQATSKARGTKVIASGELMDIGYKPPDPLELGPRVAGWVDNPDGTRLAVVLWPWCHEQRACATPQVHGCHVRAGFTAAAKK